MSDTSPATRESVVAELMAADQPAPEGPEAAEKPQPEAEGAPAEEAPAEGEGPIQDDDQPSDDPGADEPAGDDGEGEEPETPAIDAPHFWSAEAKARFAELPPDLQLVVLEQDKAGQRATAQKLEEAAAIRKAADAEKKTFSELSQRIAHAAEQAERGFADRWAKMTPDAWLKLANEDPQQYTRLRALYDAEQIAVQQATAAKDEAERVAREQWRDEQVESLKTLAPELVDPVKGDERLHALGAYLVKNGVAEQDLPNVGALEMSIALKAMKFDELHALKPTPKPQPKGGVKSGAPPPATPTKEREIQRLRNRFAQTGSREDAVALMLLEDQ